MCLRTKEAAGWLTMSLLLLLLAPCELRMRSAPHELGQQGWQDWPGCHELREHWSHLIF